MSSKAKGAERIYEQLLGALQTGSVVVPALKNAKTFRVSCAKSGDHDFTHGEVEFEAGGALQEHYGTKASMKNFECHVRVDVVGSVVLLGTQLNPDDMAKRRLYKYIRRSLLFTRDVFLISEVFSTVDPAASSSGT